MTKLYRDSYMRTLVEQNGGKMDGIIPFTAAEHGDLAATQVVNDYIGYLAIGIANIINVFQPAVVCIGGGISGQGESLMAPLREKLQYISFGTKDMRTKVVVADFKNDAGIIGAALLGLMEEN
jgi:glucokinase